jgi:hypothetical protein
MATTTTRAARRPPNLSLAVDRRPPTNTLIDRDDNRSPVFAVQTHSSNSPTIVLDDGGELQLSSPDSANSDLGSFHSLKLAPTSPDGEEFRKDLAELDELRRSVKQNLRLRPIRSSSSLSSPRPPASSSWQDLKFAAGSPSLGPLSASPSPPSTSSSLYYTPASQTPGAKPPVSLDVEPPSEPSPRAWSCSALYNRLINSRNRPLLIDTRPPAAHLISHISHSINIAVRSLILKRSRKPGGGLHSLEGLRQFITSERGKEAWDTLVGPSGTWDGDVVIYDDHMYRKDMDNAQSPSWALLPIVAPLSRSGEVGYLSGGLSAAADHPLLRTLVTTHSSTISPKGGGLFQLDTAAASSSKFLPEMEQASPADTLLQTIPSPHLSHNSPTEHIIDTAPSPPPSFLVPRKSPQKRPSVPNLRRIDTTSTERLNGHGGINGPPNVIPEVAAPPGKLTVRARPSKSVTLSVPPSHGPTSLSLHPPPISTHAPPNSPRSPTHLSLVYSNHAPTRLPSPSPTQMTFFPPPSPSIRSQFQVPTSPHTPMGMAFPSSPSTARPEDLLNPPTTEEAFSVFTVSTILPNFLFLGPELTQAEHVEELRELGVKRILNIAAECDDDHGLELRKTFEKYTKIPMRDTVEEENIARGVREVCDILGKILPPALPRHISCLFTLRR